jgi:hypothetical protein
MSDAYPIVLPGETLPASKLQDFGEQRTYTPALQATTSNPTLGSGSTATADFLLHAGFVTVGFTLQFGTSGVAVGSGTYRMTLPTTLNSSSPVNLGMDADWQDNRALGVCFASDSSAGAAGFYYFFIRASSSSPDTVVFGTSASPSVAVTNAAPFIPAASDYYRGSFTYKTDFT